MHSSDDYDIVCRYPAFEVRLNKFSGQQGLFSTESYNQGDTLIQFSIRSTQPSPTYLTIQIGEAEHFEFEPDHLKYLNHSCNPNVFLDLTNHTLIAETAIALVENDGPGGVTTPGAALGAKLVDRLQAHDGLTFTVEG